MFNKTVRFVLAIAALSSLTATVPQMAHAQTMTNFAIGGDTTPDPNITFSGGTGGTFNILVPKGFLISKVGLGASTNATISFTPLTGTGASGFQYNPTTGVYSQILTGGSFRIIDNTTKKTLLAGQFGYAVLHGTVGSCSMALTLQKNSVTYATASSMFPSGWRVEGNSFAVEFNALAPAKLRSVATTGAPQGIDGFKANDGMSFAALKP